MRFNGSICTEGHIRTEGIYPSKCPNVRKHGKHLVIFVGRR